MPGRLVMNEVSMDLQLVLFMKISSKILLAFLIT